MSHVCKSFINGKWVDVYWDSDTCQAEHMDEEGAAYDRLMEANRKIELQNIAKAKAESDARVQPKKDFYIQRSMMESEMTSITRSAEYARLEDELESIGDTTDIKLPLWVLKVICN